MMDAIKSYLLSVTAAAVICSAVLALTSKKDTTSTMIRLLTGIFMTYTILNPLIDIKPWKLEYISDGIVEDAENLIFQGKKIASKEVSEHIKTTLEAYILDKASSMQVELNAEISYDHNNGVINGVILKGNVSPYAKEILASYITDELGISREDQIWQD